MRKKARIDVLEIQEPITPEGETPASEEHPEEEGSEERPRRWFLNWKVLLLGALSLFFMGFVVVNGYHLLVQAKKNVGAPAAPTASTSPITLLELDGLSCVVDDGAGKFRLVKFGITIVPAPGKGVGWSTDNPELRSLVLRVVSETAYPDLFTVAGREEVKRRMMDTLDSEHGEGSIQAVFITSWMIL